MGIQDRVMRHFRKSLIALSAQFEVGIPERVPDVMGFGQQPVDL
jgi:hypothetical protein